VGGGDTGGQLGGGVQIAERQAQQRLQLISLGQQHRSGPGQDLPRGLDTGQCVACLPPGCPDLSPVE